MGSQLKAFREQVDKLVEVTKKTVDSIHDMIAHQNAFTQAIDVMSVNMKELSTITKSMNYSSLKCDAKLQEQNSTISNSLDSAIRACNNWFNAADFIPSRGGRALGEEMEGILLQTQGLSELFQRRWNYLVKVLFRFDCRIPTWRCGIRRMLLCSKSTVPSEMARRPRLLKPKPKLIR